MTCWEIALTLAGFVASLLIQKKPFRSQSLRIFFKDKRKFPSSHPSSHVPLRSFVRLTPEGTRIYNEKSEVISAVSMEEAFNAYFRPRD